MILFMHFADFWGKEEGFDFEKVKTGLQVGVTKVCGQ